MVSEEFLCNRRIEPFLFFLGTDATIAQHIETVIKRNYVIERMEGATKYLVPSTLGIGLVEGYNQIGLDKSLSKPQLRREVTVSRHSHMNQAQLMKPSDRAQHGASVSRIEDKE